MRNHCSGGLLSPLRMCQLENPRRAGSTSLRVNPCRHFLDDPLVEAEFFKNSREPVIDFFQSRSIRLLPGDSGGLPDREDPLRGAVQFLQFLFQPGQFFQVRPFVIR